MLYQIDITEDQRRVIQTIGDKLGYSVQQGIEQIIQDTVDGLKFTHHLFDSLEPDYTHVLLSPWDARGKAWAIGQDLSTTFDAETLAAGLVPANHEDRKE